MDRPHNEERWENKIVTSSIEMETTRKKPREKLRKRWIDIIEDLNILGVADWKETNGEM